MKYENLNSGIVSGICINGIDYIENNGELIPRLPRYKWIKEKIKLRRKNMKIVYVVSDAIGYEESFGTQPDIKLWNKIKADEFLVGDNGNDFEVKALEFENVDPNFIGFIRTLIDYDASKQTNFYVVNEK